MIVVKSKQADEEEQRIQPAIEVIVEPFRSFCLYIVMLRVEECFITI